MELLDKLGEQCIGGNRFEVERLDGNGVVYGWPVRQRILLEEGVGEMLCVDQVSLGFRGYKQEVRR